MKIGDKVRITCLTNANAEDKIIKGKVIFKNNRHFTVQGKNYRESFMFACVKCNDIGVEVIENED
ncbi:hypothetical protein BJV85_002062 [Clostridium acetobutylicum]|uniref:Uncharacterized protein n=1 Tax=Clostridium acetobutylicum (strain ATCC 824 / DSM 792 / JCM 1419 / IAM 19013 / LMG 5710 / NBRC 13948 / NRRL B-527 / VKM B-1787 / 2291 / W) TaxID=272562 RepID=Q97HS7_CLOAB|nr:MULTISPECIES: hypothetical protein [Clostridium]AAK79893.1 Hypothetical protein CA_C1931 [Clostridium acetobutylicum ATCC 824]ADZ20983.1 Conserved hypothetical protein [Clostridium acetobutylicum EA 2018]AEI32070.1 hypothetical protein SMB_G1960 [Clostridium acetobutylicum DSM 1731]AWV79675.1 hypothetical protein DK921_06090 [Clostridium acetobutylicum]MBC2394349.1 hypothetical protein [Clostridium acetobutylicum]